MNQRQSRKTKREQQFGKPPPSPPRPKELPQPNVFFVAAVAIVGIGGLLCFFALAGTLHTIWANSERQELVRTLPDVARAAPGETAILEGRIAASVPTVYREFVAYRRERYSVGNKYSWGGVGTVTPPLTVEAAGSRLYNIVNTSYVFDRVLLQWTDTEHFERSEWGPSYTYEGIVVGGPVMALGRLIPAESGALDFHADSVVGLSREVYFDRLVADRPFQWKFALGSALLAALGIYLGLRGVYRIMGWPWARPEA